MSRLLLGMGVFTQADRTTLERYCLMHEQWCDLQKYFKENPRTQLTQTGYSQITAEATLEKQLRADLLAIERQFGMTPAARSTMKVSASATSSADPLEAYIQSRGA
jgi:P27 family predicted phage terminase small subunit